MVLYLIIKSWIFTNILIFIKPSRDDNGGKKYLIVLGKKFKSPQKYTLLSSFINLSKHYTKLSLKLNMIFQANENIIFDIIKAMNSFILIATIKYNDLILGNI